MNTIVWGVVFGIAIGALDVLIMIPLKFETRKHKVEAMAGAFIERFMMGFLIPSLSLPISPVISGLILGVGLSVPTAVITRTYLPIVGFGIVSGALVGWLTILVM